MMCAEIVIAAEFWPGFAEDLSRWTLTIDETGMLRQHVRVSNSENYFAGEEHDAQAVINTNAVQELLTHAERIGFQEFQEKYSVSAEDLSQKTLSFTFNGNLKIVATYGAGFLAYRGNQAMKDFINLWDAIHKYAPFPEKQKKTRKGKSK